MFEIREAKLPDGVNGRLYLRHMPGRKGYGETFEEAESQILQAGIKTVVCLAPQQQIEQNAPEYARTIKAGGLAWEEMRFEVDDFDAPADREAFLSFVEEVAGKLRAGQKVLVHCSAGMGRTGMMAVCILLSLGMGEDEAYKAVRQAEANPEVTAQRELISWLAGKVAV